MIISSHQNALIKQIRRLQQRKFRLREGLFVVEGIRPVLAALENHWRVQQLIVCPDRLTSEVALAAVTQAEANGVSVAQVKASLIDGIGSWERSVGLLAIVESRLQPLNEWQLPDEGIFLAVEAPSDPGNLGTILRTVDAIGGRGVILIAGGTDPFHPGAVRSSMGALFSVPIAQIETVSELLDWAGPHQLPVWATSAKGATEYWTAEWPRRLVLLMGSEQKGLSEATLEATAAQLRIPMWGDSTSLNLAIATSLLLYEYRRQLKSP